MPIYTYDRTKRIFSLSKEAQYRVEQTDYDIRTGMYTFRIMSPDGRPTTDVITSQSPCKPTVLVCKAARLNEGMFRA